MSFFCFFGHSWRKPEKSAIGGREVLVQSCMECEEVRVVG